MKINRLALLTVLLGSFMALGPASQAADKPDNAPADKSAVTKGRPARGQRLQQIGEELKLTDDQKEKLKPVFQDQAKKVRELRNDKDLSREDRMAKVKEIREDLNTKLKTILTPEQLE
jgi:Spy/CpxP family protein refolding chaperone